MSKITLSSAVFSAVLLGLSSTAFAATTTTAVPATTTTTTSMTVPTTEATMQATKKCTAWVETQNYAEAEKPAALKECIAKEEAMNPTVAN